mgnify:FL=1
MVPAPERLSMKIEHVAIWCNDIESLREFYETYFDAQSNHQSVNERTGFSSYFLRFSSGARLELMRQNTIPATHTDPHRQVTGFAHLAVSVGSKDEVDRLTEQLKAAGHVIIDGPRHTGDGYYESVVLDPENNRIEITDSEE